MRYPHPGLMDLPFSPQHAPSSPGPKLPDDRYIEVDGYRVRYWDVGAGPPLVLLHGLGNSVRIWQRNVDVLGAWHRVLALDLLGHGLSDVPRRRYSLEDAADFVGRFMDAVGIASAHVAGNSMGGVVAAELALRHPARVRSVALVDSAGLGREITLFLRIGSVPGLGELLERPSYKSLYNLHRFLVYDPSCIDEEGVEAMLEHRTRPGAKRALLQFLRTGVSLRGQRQAVQRLDRLQEIEAPVLVLWGKQDRLIPVAHGEAAARATRHARLNVFEGCGHWPEYEQPEAFNAVLTAFVDGAERRRGVAPRAGAVTSPGAAGVETASDDPPGSGAAEATLSTSAAAALDSTPAREEHWFKEQYLRFLVLAVVAGMIVTVLVFRGKLANVDNVLRTVGYPALFVVALAGAAAMVVPLPSTAGIFLAGGFLTPVYVGLIAGVAEAIGEVTGYAVGFGGRGIVERNRLYARIERWVQRHGGAAVLVFAVIPNPIFDLLGIAAGALRYPLPKFLLYCWVGKTIKDIGLAYAGSLGAHWVLDLFGAASSG